MERAIYYSDDVVKPIVMSPLVIKELIETWNPEWDSQEMFYSISNSKLIIRGQGLNKLSDNHPYSSNLSFLHFLKFNHLDISGTSLESMRHIKGLELQTLDIRDTKVTNLHPHQATRDLGTVIIAPDQFSQEALNHLPPAVKIIVKKIKKVKTSNKAD